MSKVAQSLIVSDLINDYSTFMCAVGSLSIDDPIPVFRHVGVEIDFYIARDGETKPEG